MSSGFKQEPNLDEGAMGQTEKKIAQGLFSNPMEYQVLFLNSDNDACPIGCCKWLIIMNAM